MAWVEEVEMTDTIRDQGKVEQRIIRAVAAMCDEFDLGWLKVKNKFDARSDADRVICETVADWEYRQTTFVWSLHMVAALPDEELDATIMHELVHVLIAPLWSSLTVPVQEKLHHHNELSVENVCRVIEYILAKGGS
jgi:hypothetical protein